MGSNPIPRIHMNTNGIGDLAEAKITAKLVERGYIVSHPINDHARYDLIADDGEELKRIQVKHGRLEEEGRLVVANLETSNPTTKGSEYSYYGSDEIDAYMIYCSELDKCYEIEHEDAPKSNLNLRIECVHNHPHIRWAEDYEL